MKIRKPSLLLTLDSMKDPNTGFFYFGKALFENITTFNNNRFDLNFYVKDDTGFFDKSLSLINLRKYHKAFFPQFFKFDIVHISDQNCRLRPWKVMGKKVLTIHDLNQLHETIYSEKFKREYKKRISKCISNCDRIITISEFVANDVRTNFPEYAHKVSVIHNGVDKLLPKEGFTPRYIPQRPFIFTLGPLNEKKNFHVLPALLKNNNFELVISGITPVPAYTDLLFAEAEKHGVTDRIKLTGIVSDDEKTWYYQNCAAFAFPSLAEGFGLPVLEAMGFGKPVFLSTKTSLPEVGGDAAFYFEDFTPEHMQHVFSSGMKKFVEGDMAQRCIKRAESFSWADTASKYLKVYEELLT
ncbi:glycosyltransferase family 1 protein [Mucilaginibacter terrenus]|uniref:Glycosyltransferase family 1 protein n=1 Tax=Mucilaginibacter terrenus TaxID=2482727 RepID=A0A3E2NQB9_9SPHI|nr:glycosyltransferase family 1 protein [Mucilaginibacter terrenus]RFZ83189.1 glycosyltransferase family 1 protein [Mucilaginibacter terrenus]